MENPLNINPPEKMQKAVIVTLALLSLFLVVKTTDEFTHWGDETSVVQNSVSVQGQGEVFAVADIATFNFSVNETGKDVAEAQTKAADKNNAALKYLKSAGIEEKDIKTENYNAGPKYDYTQAGQKLVGYEVTQTVSVKVRNVSKAGDILSGIGATGVSNISTLSFTIDNDDALKAEARTKAIADAKVKAERLAKDLGVKLVGVASFSESESNPRPMYDMMSKAVGGGVAATVPQVPLGENKIGITVYVTYKIK